LLRVLAGSEDGMLTINDLVVALMFGALLGCLVTGVTVGAVLTESWHVEAVGHGYAHFNADHTWNWNDAPQSPHTKGE
jgi:hypothetical protein